MRNDNNNLLTRLGQSSAGSFRERINSLGNGLSKEQMSRLAAILAIIALIVAIANGIVFFMKVFS